MILLSALAMIFGEDMPKRERSHITYFNNVTAFPGATPYITSPEL
ncbi:MAG: small neutral amino acid transporter SnatA (MarC family) [Vicingaceae bacterium]|jgi:small neutral amino acid transporter SnatA (MarC family)